VGSQRKHRIEAGARMDKPERKPYGETRKETNSLGEVEVPTKKIPAGLMQRAGIPRLPRH